MYARRFQPLLLGAFMLATAFLASCGDISRIELGDFRCITSPCEANFGELIVSRPGQSAKIIVSNIGDGDLRIEAIRLEGTSSQIKFSNNTELYVAAESDYAWTVDGAGHSFVGDGYLTLAPQARLEVEVNFHPATGGRHGCTSESDGAGTIHCGDIVVVSNDVNERDRIVRAPILFSVGDSRMEVNPTAISFLKPQLADASSGRYSTQERSFTVTNMGTGGLVIQGITSDSPELVIEDDSGAAFPITVAGGLSRTFVVTWTPTSDDPFRAQITINSNASTGATRIILVSSDGGEGAGILVEPCDFDFGEVAAGSSSEMLFDVTNTGDVPMTWSIAISNVSPSSARADLDVTTPTGESSLGDQDTLQPEGTRTLKLVYSPSEERNLSADLSFRGSFGTSFSCRILGGEAQAVASIQPIQLAWANVGLGEMATRSFFVTNVGAATLEVSGISKSGDLDNEWTIRPADTAGFTVEPGATHRVEVTYTRLMEDLPSADTGTLKVNHNGNDAGFTQIHLQANHGETILPPTCALSASPEPPYTVGNALTLDASGSTLNGDGEWAPSRFQWGLESPAGSSASFVAAGDGKMTLTFDAAGTYEVTLIATAFVGEVRTSCEQVRTFAVSP